MAIVPVADVQGVHPELIAIVVHEYLGAAVTIIYA